jgi:hypothetical protein
VLLGTLFGYMSNLDSPWGAYIFYAVAVVPFVIWFSGSCPLLVWQLSIVPFAICSALTHREYPGQPLEFRPALGVALLIWVVMLVLTLPWGLFFIRRAEETRSGRAAAVLSIKPYAAIVFLIVICGFLLLVAWVMIFYPDNVWVGLGGVLLGTAVIWGLVACERNMASHVGSMREVLRLFMVMAILMSFLLPLGVGHRGTGITGGRLSVICGSLLGVESIAFLGWLAVFRSRAAETKKS